MLSFFSVHNACVSSVSGDRSKDAVFNHEKDIDVAVERSNSSGSESPLAVSMGESETAVPQTESSSGSGPPLAVDLPESETAVPRTEPSSGSELPMAVSPLESETAVPRTKHSVMTPLVLLGRLPEETIVTANGLRTSPDSCTSPNTRKRAPSERPGKSVEARCSARKVKQPRISDDSDWEESSGDWEESSDDDEDEESRASTPEKKRRPALKRVNARKEPEPAPVPIGSLEYLRLESEKEKMKMLQALGLDTLVAELEKPKRVKKPK